MCTARQTNRRWLLSPGNDDFFFLFPSLLFIFINLFIFAKMHHRESGDLRWILRRGNDVLVDPGHRNPLSCSAHQVYSLLQVPDCLIDLVVDDGLVKVVCVGLLEDLGLLLQSQQ